MAREVWTIGRLLQWTEQFFSEKGIESPRLDAEVLLAHLLSRERIHLYVHFDEPLEAAELSEFRELVKQRARRVPVAYLTGRREFMGLSFHVGSGVLIPRPDTEILVQTAIEELRTAPGATKFADLGTGSGAIALSVLHYVPDASSDATDISAEALAIAEKNAADLGLSERINLHEGDLLKPLAGQKYHAILSNPPYIPDADIPGLQPEVREHEPRIALAGGADGLDFYRRIAAGAKDFLLEGGFLAVEIGIHQADEVRRIVEENGLARAEIRRDLAGIDRVVIAWMQS